MKRIAITFGLLLAASAHAQGIGGSPLNGGGGGGGATIPATTSVLKGDGTGNGAAAIPGTDYVIPGPQSVQQQTPLPTYYVDSVNGNDALAGTSQATAWKTIAKVNTAVASTSSVAITQQVAFKSNGRWAEQLNAVSGVRYTWYGTAGTRSVDVLLTPSATNMPIIDGSDVVPGAWTSLGTGTYSATWASTVTKGYVDALYSQTTPLVLIGTCTVGNVQATAGSVCATGGTIYVHLLDNSNPTAHTIAVSGARSYGINLGAAAFVEVNGLEVIRTAKSGIVMYNAGNPTGSGNVIKGNVLFNNFDTVGDAAIGGLIGGPIAMFGGFAQSPEPGVLVQDNYVGRTDWTPNSVQNLIAGIGVSGMLNPQVIGNKVATVNGWAILSGDYYGAPTSGCYVGGNEMANSEGNVHAACPNAVYIGNFVHDSFGNGVQAGQSNVGDGTHNGNNITIAGNRLYNIRPAYSNGLFNGIDLNYVVNAVVTGNDIRKVAASNVTDEGDSAPGSNFSLVGNQLDATQNTAFDGTACATGKTCQPFYIPTNSLAAQTFGFMKGNTMLVNAATPTFAIGGLASNGTLNLISEAQFDQAYPSARTNSIVAPTLRPLASIQGVSDSYGFGTGTLLPNQQSGFALLAKTRPDVPFYNYSNAGATADQISYYLFNNLVKHPQMPVGVFLGAGGSNDGPTCGLAAGCIPNFSEEQVGSMLWAAVPNQFIKMGSTCTQTAGTWAADTSFPSYPAIPSTPGGIANIGNAVSTSSSGSVLTCTITTPTATQNVGGLFQVTNAQTGAFTVTLDGAAVTDIGSGTTTFSSGPISRNLLLQATTVFGQMWTAATSSTTHTVVITTTNANKVDWTAVVAIPPAPTANTNPVIVMNATAAFTNYASYNATTAANVAALRTAGLPIGLADLVNGTPGVNATTDVGQTATATCDASTQSGHPNSKCGYLHMAQTLYNAEIALGYVFTGPPAAQKLETIAGGTIDGAVITNTPISGSTGTFTQVIATGSTPTMAPGVAAGTTPTCTTVSGRNIAGVVTCTTGTATTTGTLATITFNGTLGTAPQGCQITPRTAATAPAATSMYTTAPSTTTWAIGAASALAASTAYSWSYICQ